MVLIALDGLSVMEGSIVFPFDGAWTATLTLEGSVAPAGRVSLSAPGAELSGTVVGGGSAYGRTTLRIVGGAGNLMRSVGPRWWKNAPVRLPLGDACDAAGETLSSSSSPDVLSVTLPAWIRAEGRASQELYALAAAAGATWRIRDDGTVWMGRDSWPTLEIDHRTADVHAADRWREIALADLSVRPGVVLDGLRVGRVTYRISRERVRCEVQGVS
jgi:hypothetical protein